MAPGQNGVSEESLVGNHIYTMPRATTLAANETKQLSQVAKDPQVQSDLARYAKVVKQSGAKVD